MNKKMVEIIECKDMMGQSKNDFINKGVAVTYRDGQGNTNTDHLPRGKIWAEFEDVAELIRVAELLNVKIINKRKKDYVFCVAGSTYYAKE